MSKQDIQERIFDLRSEQANCTPAERQRIQREIEYLYSLLDKETSHD